MSEPLINITPRKYQQDIYNTCKNHNCLVVLPTGVGKTLIGLMLTINRLKTNPRSKILFLAPTRPLTEQHLSYFKKHLPELWADMQLFTGKIQAEQRQKIWQTADIIFSTPQCISNDLKKRLYNLEDVCLLIEDECHRCLKNYAYTFVAETYKQQATDQRILGLTASPGADKATIKKIAGNLGVEAIEIRTRNSPDVKEYLQDLDYELIKVAFPPDFVEIRELLRALYQKKVDELRNRKLLFGPPTKTVLIETQRRIMNNISTGNKNIHMFLGASVCAQALKLQHALELLETQTLSSFHEYIQDLFEQARLKKSKAAVKLIKQPEFTMAYAKLTELLSKKEEHPKLLKTKEIIKTSMSNPKEKIIVFTQFRSSVTKICNELNKIPKVKAKIFVGQAKKISKSGAETGLSQKEQAQILEEFKRGEINVLCATSIAEEGLDIPEVAKVIFYEPVPSAIRKIQRAGRTARLMPGSLIMLVTTDTRDEAYHYAAIRKEKKMHSAIESLKSTLEAKNKKSQKTLF